jgi:hypothetical protein
MADIRALSDDELLRQLGQPSGGGGSAPTTPAPSIGSLSNDDLMRALAASAPPATVASVAAQIPTGFNEALADVVGAPVDAVNALLHHSIPLPGGKQIESPLGPAPEEPFMGSEFIKRRVLGAIEANPEDRPANNAPERIARGAGAGVAGMMVPMVAPRPCLR